MSSLALKQVATPECFQKHGERQVSGICSYGSVMTWDEEVIAHIRPATAEGLGRLWLAIEAEQLPLLENAATLTAAKVDLLPHQIVLTHTHRECISASFLNR